MLQQETLIDVRRTTNPTLHVSLVPYSEIENVWDKVSRHLKLATDLSRGRYRLRDVKEKLMRNEHQLWIVFEGDGNVVASITSTFTVYPQFTTLHGQFLGGDRLEEWKGPFLDVFERWGRDNGCAKIEFTGRPGWAKALADKGFKETFRIYERDLK